MCGCWPTATSSTASSASACLDTHCQRTPNFPQAVAALTNIPSCSSALSLPPPPLPHVLARQMDGPSMLCASSLRVCEPKHATEHNTQCFSCLDLTLTLAIASTVVSYLRIPCMLHTGSQAISNRHSVALSVPKNGPPSMGCVAA